MEQVVNEHRQTPNLNPVSVPSPAHYAVIHLIQPDSLEFRGHLVMFQSDTLQDQAGIAQELYAICVCASFGILCAYKSQRRNSVYEVITGPCSAAFQAITPPLRDLENM